VHPDSTTETHGTVGRLTDERRMEGALNPRVGVSPSLPMHYPPWGILEECSGQKARVLVRTVPGSID
jgi:hypothetical protein